MFPISLRRVPHRLILWAVLVVVGVFQLATLRPGHDWGDDFAQYILHARNLAGGMPYAETGYIFNPDHPNIGPAAYPPLYPLVLAPVYAVFGFNLTLFKVVQVFLLLLVLLALERLSHPWLSRFSSLLLVVVTGFNPHLTAFKDQIISEFLFISLLFLAIAAFEHLLTQEKPTPGRWIGTALLVYLAYAARSVGILLLPVFLLTEWLRTRRLPRLSLGIVLLSVPLVLLQNVLIPGTSTYFSMLKFLPVLYPVFLRVSLEFLGEFWGISLGSPVSLVVFTLFILVVLLIWVYRMLRCRHTVDFFFLAYSLAIIAWLDNQGIRLVLPLGVISGYYLFFGLDLLIKRMRLNKTPAATAKLGLALVLLAAGLPKYISAGFGPLPQGTETPYVQALFSAVRQNTQPQDVLIFFKPRAMALYTGRACSGFDLDSSDADFWARIAILQPDFIAAEHVESEYAMGGVHFYLEDFIARHPQRFELVYQNPEFKLFRVLQ